MPHAVFEYREPVLRISSVFAEAFEDAKQAILGLIFAMATAAVSGELFHLAHRHFTNKKGGLALHRNSSSKP